MCLVGPAGYEDTGDRLPKDKFFRTLFTSGETMGGDFVREIVLVEQ